MRIKSPDRFSVDESPNLYLPAKLYYDHLRREVDRQHHV